jgi:hypothetical protein
MAMTEADVGRSMMDGENGRAKATMRGRKRQLQQ